VPYKILKSFLIPLLMFIFRPKVTGLRHVPSNGPVIIASNHLSFSDSIFMPLVVPRNVTFLAKSEYFTSPGLKGFIKKITFIALGQVPIDPEGTRSPDGRLYKGRTGIARMAIESGAPVIPVAMFNTAEIQPTGQVVPKVRRVEMVFGEPMYFSGDSSDQAVLRSATNELMEKIAELSKQEYVPNMYASDAKDAIKKSLKEKIDFEEDDV
jgi:1-acyl-sn-glycerol-3-phosphate acyltransferase